MRDFEKDRRTCEAASKGPWMRLFGDRFVYTKLEDGCRGLPVARIEYEYVEGMENGKFIAAARDGWPAALERITELENRMKMQDDALERAGSAARFAISQEDAEKLRGIVFADNGDEIEKKLEQETDEIESLKRQLQVAAESVEYTCPWERESEPPSFCTVDIENDCNKSASDCWREYWRQKANSKDSGANSDDKAGSSKDSGTFQNGNNHGTTEEASGVGTISEK